MWLVSLSQANVTSFFHQVKNTYISSLEVWVVRFWPPRVEEEGERKGVPTVGTGLRTEKPWPYDTGLCYMNRESQVQCWYFSFHCIQLYSTSKFKMKRKAALHQNIWAMLHFKNGQRTSLVVQWLRICLPMQGTQVQSLVWEDPTCSWATKPVCRSHWALVP